ncbi:MAG: hypothetical protein GY809_12955 [Planctomycetes bacterium]|nr:hypothetical protein [Planctomycetota bacterium]
MTRKYIIRTILLLCLVTLLSQTFAQNRDQGSGRMPNQALAEIKAKLQKIESRTQTQTHSLLDVRPVDAKGESLVGCLYGTHLVYNNESQAKDIFKELRGLPVRRLRISDGRIRGGGQSLRSGNSDQSTSLTIPPSLDEAPLYVVHQEKRLCLLREITAAEAKRTIKPRLGPACRITGTVTSSQLSQQGRFLQSLEIRVFWRNYQPITYRTPLESQFLTMTPGESLGQEHTPFTLHLPPGTYRLAINAGNEVPNHELSLIVKAGQNHINLGTIDMPSSPFLAQYGQMAPEFGSIKSWLKQSPTSLADLKGRPLVLFFANRLTIPTIAEDAGLLSKRTSSRVKHPNGTVSGGGSRSRGSTVSRDDRQLGRIKRDFKHEQLELIAFYNRIDREDLSRSTLNFQVALNSDTSDMASRYHVTTFPATVVIDRQGRIAATIAGRRRLSVEDIEMALKTQATWRSDFERLYRLAPNEAVKFIPHASLNMREVYWHSHPYGHALNEVPENLIYSVQHGQFNLESTFPFQRVRVLSAVLGNHIQEEEALRAEFLLHSGTEAGDWIFRKDAPLADRTEGLAKVFPSHIDVRFHVDSLASETIEVSGLYHSQPFAKQAEDQILYVSVDDDPRSTSSKIKTGEIEAVFLDLSAALDLNISMEYTDQHQAQINYCIDPSVRKIRDIKQPEQRALAVAKLLTKLSQDTGLNIDYDPLPHPTVVVNASMKQNARR